MTRRTVDDLGVADLAGRESLVAAVRDLDLVAATTLLDGAHLEEVTAAVAELARVLGKDRTERVVRGSFLGPRERALRGEPVRLHQLNPTLPLVEIRVGHDDGPAAMTAALSERRPAGLTAVAELTMDSRHEGPPDSVHGGTLSFLMDCILGVLVQVTGIPAVTGTLAVRYLRRTPLDEPLTLRGRVLRRDGRKILTEGSVEHAGLRTVEASGLFVAVGQART